MLDVDEAGNFTLILSREKPQVSGTWFRIPEDDSGILVRKYMSDISTAVLPTLKIEILGKNRPIDGFNAIGTGKEHPALQPGAAN